MKKSIGALLYHYSENKDLEVRHQLCPKGENSWCKYQSDKVIGKKTYKDKFTIPLIKRDEIEPIFTDLSSDQLLTKCLHGRTQNVNEAPNQLIWKKFLKDVFVERFTLEIGVASAVINFNNGATGIIDVLKN